VLSEHSTFNISPFTPCYPSPRMLPSALSIRLIISDVDGVWTDGKIIYTSGDNGEVKEFNVRDGLGAKLAQKVGVQVALLTSRRSPALEKRARELGITELHQGATNKQQESERIATRLGVRSDETLYLGDDLPDLAPMRWAGISAAPSDAAPEVRAVAAWKLEARGGNGAFRELVERLLRERGDWDAIVRDIESGKPGAQSI
jgi:3-deoxy-D-manno-octulosonate 8-phosphate phosphatase (KDO 8-P phosphatase)